MNNEIYDIISHLMLGTASEKEMEQLDAWLAESPENRRRYEAFMARTDLTDTYTIGEKEQKQGFLHQTNWLRWGGMLLAAAACVAAVMVFVWQGNGSAVAPKLDTSTIAAITAAEQSGHNDADIMVHNADNESIVGGSTTVSNDSLLSQFYQSLSDDEAFSADIVTHHDKEFWMTLPDGTRVHLNYNTKLTYPLHFTGRNREVALEGEAYFFVAQDTHHPFIVHTRNGDVKEYGTEFNVSTRYDSQTSTGAYGIRGRGTAVVLVKGSISVITKDGSEHMLKPCDMAVLGSCGAPTVKQVDTAPFTSWNTGTFAFDDCPLDRLMDVIGRWYGLEVVFMNEASRKIRFTGELDRYNDIHNDLLALSVITGLRIHAEGTRIVIE